MLHYHMAVITRDTALKRAVKRLSTATGATAEFTPDVRGLEGARRPNLAIFDARRRTPDEAFYKAVPSDARILFILEGDTLLEKLELLADERVTSLFCHDARFDDDEFICSATKALRGEVFGLQKYFPWGVTTFTMKVKNYEEKGKAIDILMRYAKLAGVRGPVRDRVQLVCDELMMNGLYHAPVDDEGNELYAGYSVRELAQLSGVPPIQVQYGCSGRYFGVSVTDGGGSLTRARTLEYLRRALGEVEIEDKKTGAGLGLVSVMRSVSKLIFNVKPGHATEVVALFDMELFAKGKIGARSLHIFADEPEPEDTVVEADMSDKPATSGGARSGVSASATFLLVFLALAAGGMGAAYYLQEVAGVDGGEGAQPKLRVTAQPESATVTMNGDEIAVGETVTVPDGQALDLVVESPGYEPWRYELSRDDIAEHPAVTREFHVPLVPADAGSGDR